MSGTIGMKRHLACACLLVACGGSASAVRGPHGTDAGPDATAAIVDASVVDDDATFTLGPFDATPSWGIDVFETAIEDCDGGCPAGDFCAALHSYGGGRIRFGPTAALGCHPLPTACTNDPSCACLMAQPNLVPCRGDCVVDDAGTPVMRCLIPRP